MKIGHKVGLLVARNGFSVARVDPARNPVAWSLTRPLRFYLRASPVRRGKGLIQSIVLRACMNEPQALEVTLPCGAKFNIGTSEVIGRHLAIHGEFERPELETCFSLVRPGTAAFDVGANVGIFTLTMARALDGAGKVFAIEPLQHNVVRLQKHLSMNGLQNVEVVIAAAGQSVGTVWLESHPDPAYVSVRETGQSNEVAVPMVTLDEIWMRAGRPHVSFIKIDVEGNEPKVIAGATQLLAASRPHLLVEAPTADLISRASEALATFGLKPTQPPGFEPWNYLFGP
jgi:FkbM family methyltransferase